MTTDENKLHDPVLIQNVFITLFDELRLKYGFTDSGENFINNYEGITIGIEKGEIILYVLISRREAYEISILKKGNPKWKSKNWNSFFFEKFPPLSSDAKVYLNELTEIIAALEKYSFEWYLKQAESEIRFMEKHYPQIFLDGHF